MSSNNKDIVVVDLSVDSSPEMLLNKKKARFESAKSSNSSSNDNDNYFVDLSKDDDDAADDESSYYLYGYEISKGDYTVANNHTEMYTSDMMYFGYKRITNEIKGSVEYILY